MTVCTEPFMTVAAATAAGKGMPDLPIATIAHPLAGRPSEEIEHVAAQVIDSITRLLTDHEAES